ncbi:D-amino acid dehydrogenase [Nocardioides nanhaiensis]|uniref:D-amino acid dehydrogenase n=1 Tax=Nocardioides nanhaiensis TaxID=1476871 RepID=A0ABP8WFV6_9ACTN
MDDHLRRVPRAMSRRHAPHPRPRSVAVVGGGMVGLATAWHLARGGATVTVLESRHVAAGASWGNAGWLTPAKTTPLPEPAVLRYGLRSLARPSSPLYVPVRADPRLLRFLAGFARHCTDRAWARATAAYAPVNAAALDAFDELAQQAPGLAQDSADPFLMVFRSVAERDAALADLSRTPGAHAAGHEVLDGDEVRRIQPSLSQEARAGIALHGQRYIDPPAFMSALADAVRALGVEISEGVAVTSVRGDGEQVLLTDGTGEGRRFDAVVIATGAHLADLARAHGVHRLVQAGRGYSFTVAGEQIPTGPVYFPTQRVACTPVRVAGQPRLRVAGMMEFRRPDEPLDPVASPRSSQPPAACTPGSTSRTVTTSGSARARARPTGCR